MKSMGLPVPDEETQFPKIDTSSKLKDYARPF